MNDELMKMKQEAATAVDNVAQIVASNASTQPWSPTLVTTLGLGILVFCLIVLLIAANLLRDKLSDALVVLKVFGIVLIVCMSAFLMIAGYGQDQLTPIVGLFGAIAGYLLGKEHKTA